MLHLLTRNWWVWLLRGILAILFGAIALRWPLSAITAFGIVFGAYALVDGVFALAAAVRAVSTHQRWWPLLVEAIVGIAIGAIAFTHLGVIVLALDYTIAIWAILTGVVELAAAAQFRAHLANEIWLIIGGLASLVFGVLMFAFPLAGLITLTWLIGWYAILFGALLIAFSFRLRSHAVTIGT